MSEMPGTGILLIAHVVTSLLACAFAARLMPGRYRPSWRRQFALYSLWALFIPVLGAVMAILLAAYARVLDRDWHEHPYRLVRLPVFTSAPRAPSLTYGAGSIHSRLVNETLPREVRLKALLAVQALPGNLSTRLLRDVLRDPSDDLRLTAYGMLDKGEKRINQHIEAAQARLDQNQANPDRAALHRQLASHYWELVYQHYAQGELRAYALESAHDHARRALDLDAGDADTWVLAGRIALAKEDTSHARQCFDQAGRLAVPAGRIRPFLAELAFLRRDFAAVRELMGGLGAQEQNYATAPLLAFWRPGART